MILNIAFKDFYNNIISARFVIGFVLCLFLIPFTMLVSINDYRSQVMNYEVAREEAKRIEGLEKRISYRYCNAIVLAASCS